MVKNLRVREEITITPLSINDTFMNEDQRLFIDIIAFDVNTLNNVLVETGFRHIPGTDDLINTMHNGKPLGKKKQRFLDNLNKSFKAYRDDAPDFIIDKCPIMMIRTLDKLYFYVDKLSIDDPIAYHSKHLKGANIETVSQYMEDQSVATRRIDELLSIKKPALMLPAVKDQYVLAFEKLYKEMNRQLTYLFKELIPDKESLNKCVEDILAFKEIIEVENKRTKKVDYKSDFRCIRNLLVHPEVIDRYDHYHLELEDKLSLDLRADELHGLTLLLMDKVAILQVLCRVIIDFKLYEEFD